MRLMHFVYKYSSYHYYAYGKNVQCGKILTQPPAYIALGKTPEQRQKKYRQLCDLYLKQENLISDIPEDKGENFFEQLLMAQTQMIINEKQKRENPG